MAHTNNQSDAETLDEGTLLGRYEIRRLIGRGGMGCVYEALHRDLKKRVAIKTLMPSLSANQEARVRFIREGEAASRIRHPNVVDVTDVGVEGNTSYLVMEYLEGEDLATHIGRMGSLSPMQTADIMLPVSAAIATAHQQGVIHRDLKPANVFLAASALGGVQPKVLDFGISKVMGDRGTMVLTGTGATFGTTFYLPPEQLQAARQADAKSDQYALATILYECVTGQRAFENDNLYTVLKNIAEGRYEAPRARRPDLPSAMEALIIRAMNVEPSARFPSVMELGAALLDFASPQSRVMWAPFFGDAIQIEESQGLGYGMAGGTMILPPAAEVARRISKPLPQPVRRLSQAANSTLGNATGESMMPFGAVPNLRKSRAPLFIGIGAVAIVGAAVGVLQLMGGGGFSGGGMSSHGPSDPPPIEKKIVVPPPTFRVEVETDPREATIELDGRPAGSGVLDRKLPSDGASHVMVVRAPGYRDSTVRFIDRPPPHLMALDPIAPPKADTASGTQTRGGSGSAHASDDGPPDRAGKATGGGHSSRPAAPDRDPRRGLKKHRHSSGAPDDGPKPARESSQTANNAPIID